MISALPERLQPAEQKLRQWLAARVWLGPLVNGEQLQQVSGEPLSAALPARPREKVERLLSVEPSLAHAERSNPEHRSVHLALAAELQDSL